MRHSLLGEKVEYDELNAKQQEAYNLQKVSSIFAEYGWLVIKLSDDWNGADFIASKFGSDDYLKVQLKSRFGFWKKYIGQNISICFCDRSSGNWYLYPHDELCEVIIENYKDTESWKDKGIFHWPSLPPEHRNQLEQYIIKMMPKE